MQAKGEYRPEENRLLGRFNVVGVTRKVEYAVLDDGVALWKYFVFA